MLDHNVPRVAGRVPSAEATDRNRWFVDHVEKPAAELEDFLRGTNLSLTGARVLDVGCGDGFIDIGLLRKFQPTKVMGVDLVPTDVDELQKLYVANFNEELPKNLTFGTCTPTTIPLPDESFDVVFSWSVFEHVTDPVAVFNEMHRLLRPGGFMFLQIWPLYRSQRGSHLWNWYPDGWEHMTRSHDELRDEIRLTLQNEPELLEATSIDFDSLNCITVDELQSALSSAGFKIRRVSFQADTIDVPESLLRYRLSDLAISGVKLLATR